MTTAAGFIHGHRQFVALILSRLHWHAVFDRTWLWRQYSPVFVLTTSYNILAEITGNNNYSFSICYCYIHIIHSIGDPLFPPGHEKYSPLVFYSDATTTNYLDVSRAQLGYKIFLMIMLYDSDLYDHDTSTLDRWTDNLTYNKLL